MNISSEQKTKSCNECGEVKLLTEFSKNAAKKDGLSRKCRSCSNKCVKRRRDQVKERNLKRRKLEPDAAVTHPKFCYKCGVVRDRKDFHKNAGNSDGLQELCRFCRRKQRADLQEELSALKKQSVCVKCGYSDHRALDYAHNDRKEKARTKDGRRSKTPSHFDSIRAWNTEIPKVQVMCTVCHRLATFKEHIDRDDILPRNAIVREKRRELYKFVSAEKMRIGACTDCKRTITESNLVAFDFDHLPQFDKTAGVSEMAANLKPKKEIEAEIAKCELLCANCHRIRTDVRKTDERNRITIEEVMSDMVHEICLQNK